MRAIALILFGTPWWVFGLLALLLWLGLRALRRRTMPIWQLLITPAIFIGWGVASLALRSLSSPVLLLDWLATAAVAAALAGALSRLGGVSVDRARQFVSIEGSAVPIVRNVLIFIVKYALGVAVVLLPASRFELYALDIAVSGATAGYFLGWLLQFASIYRRAPAERAAA